MSKLNPSKFEKNKDEYEDIIAKVANYSYFYANHVLNGRFEKGEYKISTNKYDFFHYYKRIKSKPNTISFYYKFI